MLATDGCEVSTRPMSTRTVTTVNSIRYLKIIINIEATCPYHEFFRCARQIATSGEGSARRVTKLLAMMGTRPNPLLMSAIKIQK